MKADKFIRNRKTMFHSHGWARMANMQLGESISIRQTTMLSRHTIRRKRMTSSFRHKTNVINVLLNLKFFDVNIIVTNKPNTRQCISVVCHFFSQLKTRFRILVLLGNNSLVLIPSIGFPHLNSFSFVSDTKLDTTT